MSHLLPYLAHGKSFLEISKDIVDKNHSIVLNTQKILSVGPTELNHFATVPLNIKTMSSLFIIIINCCYHLLFFVLLLPTVNNNSIQIDNIKYFVHFHCV